MYKEYKENDDILTIQFKEVLTEEELADRPDWEGMGLPAPEDELSYKWQEMTIRKSYVYAVTEDIGEDGYATIFIGAEALVINMTVEEALNKIFGIKLV